VKVIAVEIRQLGEGDTVAFRALRHMGLQESPDAFGESIAEFEVKTVEHVAEMLNHHGRGDFVLGAFISYDLVGVIGFYTYTHAKMAHKGSIWGAYVNPSNRSQSIGRSLLKSAVGKAALIPGLRQLNLTVVVDNVVAVRLYEQEGFRVTGKETAALRVSGRYIDEFFMQKVLV
jgi:RimJ/RimL family protein N-acetyltransferase